MRLRRIIRRFSDSILYDVAEEDEGQGFRWIGPTFATCAFHRAGASSSHSCAGPTNIWSAAIGSGFSCQTSLAQRRIRSEFESDPSEFQSLQLEQI